MVNDSRRVVLDSNILISAYIFGGKPENILQLVIAEKIQGITSQNLITEFLDVLRKKFGVSQSEIIEIQNEIQETFEIVYPSETLHIVNDEPDNRVLEAAIQGNCNYIITGDKELLKLGSFQNIQILTADEFLEVFKE